MKTRELTEVANMSAKVPYEETCFLIEFWNWFYLTRIGNIARTEIEMHWRR